MPKIITVLIIFISAFIETISVENYTLELIEREIALLPEGDDKTAGLLDLAIHFEQDSIALSIEYASQALESAEHGSEELQLKVYQQLGELYLHADSISQAILLYRELLNKFPDFDSLERSDVHLNLGIAYKNIGNYKNALLNYQKALTIIDPVKDSINGSLVFYNMGLLYTKLGDFENAINSYMEAHTRNILSGDNDSYFLAEVSNSVAALYLRLGNSVMASNYLDKTLKYLENSDESDLTYIAKNNVAANLNHLGKYSKALNILKNILKEYDINVKPKLLTLTYNNIGESYMGKEEYDKAARYFFDALEINKELGMNEGVSTNLLNIGTYYTKKKNTSQAIHYYRKVDSILEIKPINYIQLSLYKHYADAYKEGNDLANTMLYKDKYIHLKDSLFDLKRNFNLSMVMNAYEEADNQRVISEFRLQQLKNERALNSKNNLITWFAFLAVALLIISYVIFYRLRTKTRFEKEILKKNKELTEAKVQIEEAFEREKELGEIKTNFISMVSHQYRNPLSIIMVTSELLESAVLPKDVERTQRYFANIRNSVKSMSEMLDQVLFVSRSQLKTIIFDVAKIKIVSHLKSIIERYQLINENNVAILFDYDDKNICLNYDRNAFDNIVSNLLSNALKYSHKNGTVNIAVKALKEEVVLTISDSGIGIPFSEQKFLFEPFHRFSNAKEIKGTGLGLYIVRQSVDAGSAKISVTSDKDQGTTFTVTFPVTQPQKQTTDSRKTIGNK